MRQWAAIVARRLMSYRGGRVTERLLTPDALAGWLVVSDGGTRVARDARAFSTVSACRGSARGRLGRVRPDVLRAVRGLAVDRRNVDAAHAVPCSCRDCRFPTSTDHRRRAAGGRPTRSLHLGGLGPASGRSSPPPIPNPSCTRPTCSARSVPRSSASAAVGGPFSRGTENRFALLYLKGQDAGAVPVSGLEAFGECLVVKLVARGRGRRRRGWEGRRDTSRAWCAPFIAECGAERRRESSSVHG